ncbi:MAG: hypothetical protein ABIV28_07135, partial [Longimicrobiales bacterium]
AGLYTRMGYKMADDPELQEMLRPLDSAGIEKELLAQINDSIHNRKLFDGKRHRRGYQRFVYS